MKELSLAAIKLTMFAVRKAKLEEPFSKIIWVWGVLKDNYLVPVGSRPSTCEAPSRTNPQSKSRTIGMVLETCTVVKVRNDLLPSR